MAASHQSPSIFHDFWSQAFAALPVNTDQPPSKRTKTSHPAPIICCDQPCNEDETLCFDDYCHDFCTDSCHEPCADHCQVACSEDCPTPCPDDCQHAVEHHHLDCENNCVATCDDGCTLNHCELDCAAICTSLDDCVDPSTACLDNCGTWCDFHYSADCFDCMSSPTASDVKTPQMPMTGDASVPARYACHYLPHLIGQSFTPPTPQLHTTDASTAIQPATERKHICLVAGCTAGAFEDEDALQSHIEDTHLVKINGRYVCQWKGCVKRVTKKSNDHISREKAARAQGKTYVPPAEPFSDEHLHKLKRHYYVHSGKKAFECVECGSVHATKAQLKVHMARHAPKDFLCEECDKVFTTQNQLKTHINAVHKKEKHFRCPDCDYACDDSSNMSSHKRKQHQYGVPCPSHVHGCSYKDGRQAEMDKHMRANGHGAWIIDDKDAFEIYWKRERRVAEDERLRDEAQRFNGGVGRVLTGKRNGKQRPKDNAVDYPRTQSFSTSVSGLSSGHATVESTPAAPDLTFDQFTLMPDPTFSHYPFQAL